MAIEQLTLTGPLIRLALSESGFVFDPVSGQSFTVNDTGLEILRSLQHDANLGTTLELLTDKYDASQQEIERDIDDFLATLKEQVGI